MMRAAALSLLLVLCAGRVAAATFVLVHGAFVGGWYWAPVAAGLRDKGHVVIAPDLTGHGALADAKGAAVDLETHVRDVLAAIESVQGRVILVAHSYGGKPATGAWDRARDRVAAVIFLEALLPELSGTTLFAEDIAQRQALARANPAAVAAGLLPPTATLGAGYPGQMLVAQSLSALHGGLEAQNGPLPETPGAYVLGEKSFATFPRHAARRGQAERGWTIWEIESGHDMVADAGAVLVRLLDDLARDLPRPD